MHAVTCADLGALEERLVQRTVARPRGGLGSPLLVLVPTSRLVDRVKRLVLARADACLALHVHTHRSFCHAALRLALVPPPRDLPGAAWQRLVLRAAEEVGGVAAERVREYPGERRALARTLRELREAGVTAAELAEAIDGAGGPGRADRAFLTGVYRAVEPRLEELAAGGWADPLALVRAALPALGRFVERKSIAGVIHHGAYELTGANTELLGGLAALGPPGFVELLVPTGAGRPVFRYAERYLEVLARRVTLRREALEPAAERRAWLARIASVRDDHTGVGAERTPPPDGAPEVELRDVAGSAAELEAAALRACALHDRDGVPWHEIAVVARSLDEYAPFLASVFARAGVPVSTSAREPLVLGSRVVRDLLRLLRVLAGDFERAAVVDLLRARRFAVSEAPLEPGDVDCWDRVSRDLRVVRGVDAWRDVATNLAGSRTSEPGEGDRERARAERLTAVLDVLAADAAEWRDAGTFAAHRAVVAKLARARLGATSTPEGADAGSDAHDLERLLETLDAVARVEEIARAGAAPAVGPADVLRLLEEAASAKLAPLATARGGVRVLDVMQARGLSHRVVQWIGFHRGLFPRPAREDPWLAGSVRERLREQAARPIGGGEEAGEEDLLLAVTLASARERLAVSFQRADESGKARGRSPAVRELARVLLGVPSARELLAGEPPGRFRPWRLPVPRHERVRTYAKDDAFGLVPPLDAALALGATAPGRAAETLAELGLDTPANAAALARVAAAEDFESPGGRADVDAMTGAGIAPERLLSPTSIERLARCPLAWFLDHVLGVEGMADEAEEHRLEVRLLGGAVHDALERLYRHLAEKAVFGEPVDSARPLALRQLAKVWPESLRAAVGASRGRLAGLFGLLEERWLRALEEFVSADVEGLCEAGVEDVDLETEREARLDLGDGVSVRIRGRFDRLVTTADGVEIDDYKTSGNLGKRRGPSEMLRGEHAQLPLYAEIVALAEGLDPASVRARLLGVGPSFEGAGKGAEAVLGWKSDGQREGFLETVRVVVSLARAGWFPLVKHARCSYCTFRRACPRNHRPTTERLARDERLAEFRALAKKNGAKPHLADLSAD